MTAPHRAPDQNSAAARGVVLVVVAVVIGAFFLARGNSGSLLGNQGRAGAASPTSTSAPPSTTPPTTPTTSKPASATKVAIYNGTGGKVTSAAGNSRTKLVSVGYTQANISINDTGQLPTTAIYYQGTVNQTDAGAVASALGFAASAIQSAQAAPTAIPASAKSADIVVMIGLDAQNNPAVTGSSTASTSTTTSTAPTNTTTSTTG